MIHYHRIAGLILLLAIFTSPDHLFANCDSEVNTAKILFSFHITSIQFEINLPFSVR